MREYSRVLGGTVKRARLSLKLTQKRVAEQINVDERTIMNVESAKQESLFIGILHGFAQMRIPQYVLTDNMKSVVFHRVFEEIQSGKKTMKPL